jgi:hypothetical protein
MPGRSSTSIPLGDETRNATRATPYPRATGIGPKAATTTALAVACARRHERGLGTVDDVCSASRQSPAARHGPPASRPDHGPEASSAPSSSRVDSFLRGAAAAGGLRLGRSGPAGEATQASATAAMPSARDANQPYRRGGAAAGGRPDRTGHLRQRPTIREHSPTVRPRASRQRLGSRPLQRPPRPASNPQL